MITTEQIIEAAKECGYDLKTDGFIGDQCTWNVFSRFANHFYKQGLLDGAEKCENPFLLNRDSKSTAKNLAEAIRQMAEEIK